MAEDEKPWGQGAYRSVGLSEEEVNSVLDAQKSSKRRNMIQAPHARPIAPLTRSQHTSSQVPTLGDRGPLHDIMKIEHPGPIELLWAKIRAFVNSLENTDIVAEQDFNIQAYHYALPRYVLFRIQIFQNQNETTPFVVEFQRREGDSYAHSVLFQHLRAVLSGQGSDAPVPRASPYNRLTPESEDIDFQSLDLSQSEEDLQHWILLMNQNNLLSAQSATNCIALASRNKKNFPYILKAAEAIIDGFMNCFEHSEDPPTVFAGSVVLSTLAVDREWCETCLRKGLLETILATIDKWSGRKKLKSKQIVVNLLVLVRCIIENLGRERFLESAGENINTLVGLAKSPNLDADVSILLNSVLQLLDGN